MDRNGTTGPNRPIRAAGAHFGDSSRPGLTGEPGHPAGARCGDFVLGRSSQVAVRTVRHAPTGSCFYAGFGAVAESESAVEVPRPTSGSRPTPASGSLAGFAAANPWLGGRNRTLPAMKGGRRCATTQWLLSLAGPEVAATRQRPEFLEHLRCRSEAICSRSKGRILLPRAEFKSPLEPRSSLCSALLFKDLVLILCIGISRSIFSIRHVLERELG